MKWFRQKKYASRRGWLAGIFCSVLAVTVMVAAVPLFTTHAETWEVQLDENGEAHDGSVHYKLEDGVLTVSGTGKIRYEAFYGYSGITSIVIESGITEIGGGAFRNTSLTSVTIPGNVKAINSDAFFQCKNLTALTIQEGVEVLGSSAFNQCEKLTSITLPSSVKEIYSYAFNFCPLTNLTFQSSITNEQNSAVDFNYLAKTTLVHIPNDFKINGVTITPENKSEYFKDASVVFVPVTGISLPSTFTVELYADCYPTLTFTPSNASVQNVTWTSSDNSVVTPWKTFDGFPNGKLVTQSPGTATVTATTQDGGHNATCTVTVIRGVTGVTLNQNTLSLPKGTTANLTANVSPNNASNKNVTWSSSDASVATVNLNGTVTAKSKGTARITVTTEDGNKTAHCDVTVTEPVTGVTLNKPSLTLKKGASETLTANVEPSNADNQNVSWSSSDDNVATVENGIVTGVAKGSATITVTTEDGDKTATCTVTVTQPVTGVTLNKDSLNLLKGESETLTATVEPSNANNKNVTWSSSDDNVATVENGTVTAVEGGTAKITVTTKDGSFTADCTVKVTQPVTGVTLNKTSLKLEVNQTADLTATVVPSNADNKNITWASTNETVATVENGTVTAKAPGQATIAAIPEDDDHLDPDQTDVCTVTVTPPVAQVMLNKESLSLIETQSATLTATVEPDDANNKNVTWSSSDDSVAKVDQNGEVTAVGAGTAKITITTEDGGKTATCAVTVQPLYQLNEPKSQTKWYKGSTDGTTFTFNNQVDDTKTYTNFDSYTGDKVFVDGNAVNDYDAASGSLILTLKAAYLETLGVGDHTLKVMFTDGSAYIIFTVSPKPAAVISSASGYELQSASAGPTTYDSPYTGDSSGSILMNVLLLGFLAAGAAYTVRKFRNGYSNDVSM